MERRWTFHGRLFGALQSMIFGWKSTSVCQGYCHSIDGTALFSEVVSKKLRGNVKNKKWRWFVPNLVPIWSIIPKLQAVKQSGPVFGPPRRLRPKTSDLSVETWDRTTQATLYLSLALQSVMRIEYDLSCCHIVTRDVREQAFRTKSLSFPWLHSYSHHNPVWNLHFIPIFPHGWSYSHSGGNPVGPMGSRSFLFPRTSVIVTSAINRRKISVISYKHLLLFFYTHPWRPDSGNMRFLIC